MGSKIGKTRKSFTSKYKERRMKVNGSGQEVEMKVPGDVAARLTRVTRRLGFCSYGETLDWLFEKAKPRIIAARANRVDRPIEPTVKVGEMCQQHEIIDICYPDVE